MPSRYFSKRTAPKNRSGRWYHYMDMPKSYQAVALSKTGKRLKLYSFMVQAYNVHHAWQDAKRKVKKSFKVIQIKRVLEAS